MNITKLVTELRKSTGLGIAQCSKLLKENGGDIDKAILASTDLVGRKIERMQNRQSGSGRVFSYVHTGGKKGAMVHLFSETDFVSNTEEFSKLGNDLVLHIVAMEPKTVEELVDQPFVRDGFIKVNEMIQSLQVKVGEKIEVKNFSIFGN